MEHSNTHLSHACIMMPLQQENKKCLHEPLSTAAVVQRDNSLNMERNAYEFRVDEITNDSHVLGAIFEYVPIYERVTLVRRVAPSWKDVVTQVRFFKTHTFRIVSFWINDFASNTPYQRALKHWFPHMSALFLSWLESKFVVDDIENKYRGSSTFGRPIAIMMSALCTIKSSIIALYLHVHQKDDLACFDNASIFNRVKRLTISDHTFFHANMFNHMPMLTSIDVQTLSEPIRRVDVMFDISSDRNNRNNSVGTRLQRLRCQQIGHISVLSSSGLIDKLKQSLHNPCINTFMFRAFFEESKTHFESLLMYVLVDHPGITNIGLRLLTSYGYVSRDIESSWLSKWSETTYPHVRTLDLVGWFRLRLQNHDDAANKKQSQDEFLAALVTSFPRLECLYVQFNGDKIFDWTISLLEAHPTLRVVILVDVYNEQRLYDNHVVKYLDQGASLLQCTHNGIIYIDSNTTQTTISATLCHANQRDDDLLSTIMEHTMYCADIKCMHGEAFGIYAASTSLLVWKNKNDEAAFL